MFKEIIYQPRSLSEPWSSLDIKVTDDNDGKGFTMKVGNGWMSNKLYSLKKRRNVFVFDEDEFKNMLIEFRNTFSLHPDYINNFINSIKNKEE